ncbi:progestin and adipoq receptor family member 3 [Plakobranchus ocellatus]|uniref:Progestin and adipoq receptor family member 3 n=1 Tax=Plakobranchus ocellatus TaxID=259542 RepID=A0AAV4C1N4_9GAST|nr:progestin and adipoq receptor family member 3 [Plakobranchus ocellatus]
MDLPLYGRYDEIKNRQAKSVQSTQKLQGDTYHILELEIDDRSVKACQTGICVGERTEINLLKYHEAPDFLKTPYVLHGYRSRLPPDLCMKSLIFWTNETLNIWSHLMGFFIFLLLVLYDNLVALPQIGGSFADHFIITLGLCCFMFCMVCSTGYHIFYCHSERASRKWLAIDMTGVSIGIIGCYLPAVHYAFYCLSIWRDVYMFIIVLLSACTLGFQLHPRFFTHEWFCVRMLLYVGLVAYGIVPTIHWVYLSGGISSFIVQVCIYSGSLII